MIIRKVFDWTEDHEYGPGFVMRNMPGFDPVQGVGFAHDCLEHLDTAIGLEAEMRAFGVILWGRAMSGYWAQFHPLSISDPAYHLSGDMLRFIVEADYEICPPARKPKKLGEEEETILAASKALVLKNASMEYGDDCEQWGYADESDMLIRLNHDIDIALDWMRVGYRKAEKRYSHTNSDEFSYIFKQIADEFDRVTRRAEPGSVVKFSLDTQSMEWKLRHVTEYSY